MFFVFADMLQYATAPEFVVARALLALLTGGDEVEGQREGCSGGQSVFLVGWAEVEMSVSEGAKLPCRLSQAFRNWGFSNPSEFRFLRGNRPLTDFSSSKQCQFP